MSRTWLITGSSRGLGRELAEAVLADGDQLLATARRPEQLEALEKRYPGRVRSVARAADEAKIASDEQWQKLALSTDQDGGDVDIDDLRHVTANTGLGRAGTTPGPFIFIATNKLKPGALEAERQRVPELSDFLEAREPRLIAFNEYVNQDQTEVTVVQVHADSDSMELHMGVVRERAQRAYAETLDGTSSIQVVGTPSETVLETLRHQAGAGVPISMTPVHLGGFTRVS